MKIKHLLLISVLLSVFILNARGQDRKFGFGVLIGEPTGISLKNWLTPTTAIDAGMAWSFVKETSLHIHVDYLFHTFNLLDPKEKMPLYLGVGGRIKTGRYEDARFGLRMVVGVDYIFKENPFDVFFEIAPILDLVPATVLRGNIGIGVRYFIN